MNQKYVQKYVKLILERAINIQPGQKVLITCPIEEAWFAHELTRAAYAAGSGEVFYRWSDEKGAKIRYTDAPDDIFDSYPAWSKLMLDTLCKEKAAFISVSAADPNALSGAPQDRIQRAMKAASVALKDYQDSVMGNSSQWCVMSIPSKAWAQKIFPDLSLEDAIEKLWETIFYTSRVDDNDPIENWNNHIATLNRRREALNDFNFKALVYKNSLGTNLTLELPEGHVWTAAEEHTQDGVTFIANVPTEEIFTAPKRDGVNGIVYATKPLVYMGDVIDGFSVEFKDGRAIKVSAEKNQELLEKLISIVPGADYLGEVALVPHDSPISNSGLLFYNTLFDENASCHLALGKAYPTTVKNTDGKTEEELMAMGLNCAMQHEDFMIGSADMSIIGITHDGREIPVFVNGNFAF